MHAQGLRFYLGMHEVEKRCRQEADDFVFTRNVQRDELKQVRAGDCCSVYGSGSILLSQCMAVEVQYVVMNRIVRAKNVMITDKCTS